MNLYNIKADLKNELIIMHEENFSPEQSLKIIQTMIEKTKNDFLDVSFYYLFWGWLVFVAALGQYILISISFAKSYLIWNLMWLGMIVSITYSIMHRKKVKVKTYMGESMAYLGLGIGICFTILGFIFSYYDLWEVSAPIYYLLYGLFSFMGGAILRFYYLKWAAVFCWLIAIVSVFLKVESHLLLTAATILVAYIVPGYLLKAKHARQTN